MHKIEISHIPITSFWKDITVDIMKPMYQLIGTSLAVSYDARNNLWYVNDGFDNILEGSEIQCKNHCMTIANKWG